MPIFSFFYSSLEFMTWILDFDMKVTFFPPRCTFFPSKFLVRFLNGFEENVISGQRSIRIFGKRFMESEMTIILVQGVGPEQKKVVFFKNHDFVKRKFNSKFQVFCWFSKNLVVFPVLVRPPALKCLSFLFP